MNNQIIKTEAQSLSVSVIDHTAISGLLPAERKIIEVALQPKIDEQKPVDVVTGFIALITQAYTRAGYKMPDENTLALYADEFYQSLLEKFPKVSIPEIREAFKEGVYGEYGEFTGLNPKSFMQFVRGYVSSSTRKEAIKLFETRRQYIGLQRQLLPEEKEEQNMKFVNALFDDYKAGNLISDYIPTFVYEFFEQLGLIKLTLEDKRRINELAKFYLVRLKTSKRYVGNTGSIGDELKAFVRNRSEENTLKIISKQFAVAEFFEAEAQAGKETIFSLTKKIDNG